MTPDTTRVKLRSSMTILGDKMGQPITAADILTRIAALNEELSRLRRAYLHAVADERPMSNLEALEFLVASGATPAEAQDIVRQVNDGRWKRWYRTATVNMNSGAISVEDLLDPDSAATRFHIEPWSRDDYCSTDERLDAALIEAGFRRLSDCPWRDSLVPHFRSTRVIRTGAKGIDER